MTHAILLDLTIIVVAGIAAQWLAWRLRLPSILLLLLFGLVLGPATGLIDPKTTFGDLLIPVVSISVALILFDGGLTLRFSELPKIRGAVFGLVSIGALTTWAIASSAAYFILGLNFDLAALLGAILVVTGPTVTEPMLRHIRPTAKLNSVLKWEGIVIDPIGAMLAVLVFEMILAAEIRGMTILVFMLKTVSTGSFLGLSGALLLIFALRRYLIPDFLQNPVATAIAIGVFSISNTLHPESGLLAVTIMGIALANQKTVSVKHITEFNKNLRVLLISGVFILLASRLDVGVRAHVGPASLAFVAVLIFIARPLAVALSTCGKNFNWRERLFMSWMAPRGIVAAAVSSVFALALKQDRPADAETLLSQTFIVIIATVAIYGLTASTMARRLKVAQPDPQGILILGGHEWAREIASILDREGVSVKVIDNNWENITATRLTGVAAYFENALSDTVNEIEFEGLGNFLALTANNEINALATLRFAEIFGRSNVYQLSGKIKKKGEKNVNARPLYARLLFNEAVGFDRLQSLFDAGATIKSTQITEAFTYADFLAGFGRKSVRLFAIDSRGHVSVFNSDDTFQPGPGSKIINIAPPAENTKLNSSVGLSGDYLLE